MHETHSKPSLLERLSAFIMREPEDREQLIELLHSAHERNLLDAAKLGKSGNLSIRGLDVKERNGEEFRLPHVTSAD